MNKYQEYKEALHRLIKFVDFPDSQQRAFDKSKDEPRKFYVALQELVDKEKPEKPIKSGTIYHDFEPITKYECKCGRNLSFAYNYCPKCGQKIDWQIAKNQEV